jgi:hypothetical protein
LPKDSKDFLINNHLMGVGSGKSYGLYFENKLVALIQIRKKGKGIEISRFCTKLNMGITGGLSKFLKHIEKEYQPEFIESFVDLRYGDGKSLQSLGFQKITEDISFKWTNFKETVHRMTFPNNTGYENGWFKIWDCGQAKFIKHLLQPH